MKLKGSITLYMSLSLLLIFTLLLTLVESVRLYGIKARSSAYTKMALESLFGGYSSEIWEKYRLLMLDGRFQGETFSLATGEAKLMEIINLPQEDRIGVSFYPLKAEEIEIISYSLMTDHDGQVFQKQVTKSMSFIMAEKAAKSLWNKLKKEEESQEEIDLESLMNNGEQSMARTPLPESSSPTIKKMSIQLTTLAEKEIEKETEKEKEPEPPPYNPISSMRAVSGISILQLVIPSQKISGFQMELGDTLLKRPIRKGNEQTAPVIGWYEKILTQEYAIRQFSSFLDHGSATSGKMQYQLEYLIAGSGSDQKNLESTAGKLLAVRGAMNYLYLLSDEARKGEAMVLALALSTAAGNPGAAETVHKGILAAWSLAESVADVRSLMSGGKVPWKKMSSDWKTSLLGMGDEAVGKTTVSDNERGADYQDYIRMFLFLQSSKKLTYRMMDLMEHQYTVPGSRKLKMDEMIQGLKIRSSYRGKALFLSLFQMTFEAVGQYRLTETERFTY